MLELRHMAKEQRTRRIAMMKMSSHPDTRFMVLKRSRHDPQPGDLFLMNLLGKRWILGRVVANDCRSDRFTEYPAVLLYIYDMKVIDPDDIRTPIPPKLLIPPELTNRQGWTQGWLLHVRNEPMTPSELLPRHVFDGVAVDGRFRNEYAQFVDAPSPGELVACSGLASILGIEESISEALGIVEKSGP